MMLPGNFNRISSIDEIYTLYGIYVIIILIIYEIIIKGEIVMDKSRGKFITKCAAMAIIYAIVLAVIGFIVVNFISYDFKDVLFIESIIVIIVGALSLNSGKSMGLSLQGLGQSNAQYISNANLEITKMENEKKKPRSETNWNSTLNMISLIVAGIICIIIAFIT